jgi:mRNA-degrading endonuclease YafQ of YafQ-DinJ toxin-antitoxin module
MKEYLISWSPVAEETYLKTLNQILDKWTVKEAEDFERLKSHKHLCPPSDKLKNLRRCVISPQTSLIYQINNNDIIELVAFFDNRSGHAF